MEISEWVSVCAEDPFFFIPSPHMVKHPGYNFSGKERSSVSHTENSSGGRMSERWISKANCLLYHVDLCKQTLIFQFQLHERRKGRTHVIPDIPMWRPLFCGTTAKEHSSSGWNWLFLYSLFHNNSIKKTSKHRAGYMDVFTLWKFITWYEHSQFVYVFVK